MKKAGALRIRKIGIVIKHHQPEAAVLAGQVTEFILAQGKSVFFAEEAQLLAKGLAKTLRAGKKVQTVAKHSLAEVCDLIVVLGGDGTFLSIARQMKKQSIPIMGVNMGQLGFLTEISREEAIPTLQQLFDGVPPIYTERPLLEVTLLRKNKTVFQGPVVNDAVISKGAIARIIGMDLWVNDKWVNYLRADGIIVSTTTGSTAYALAAGGPIVEPSVSALVVAPICPHSLTLRPLVIPESSEVKICLNDRPGHVLLTLDGQDVVTMREHDIVTIKRFKKHSLKIIAFPTRDYFSILREKLKYGARD